MRRVWYHPLYPLILAECESHVIFIRRCHSTARAHFTLSGTREMATQRQQQQCVGCGRIDTCAKNRRRLTTTEAGMKVKETWELFVKEKLKGDYETPDRTKITDDDIMCCTCFSNYERYVKAKEVIDEAIKGFMKFEFEPELDIPPCKLGKVTVSFHCSIYTPGIILTT